MIGPMQTDVNFTFIFLALRLAAGLSTPARRAAHRATGHAAKDLAKEIGETAAAKQIAHVAIELDANYWLAHWVLATTQMLSGL